MFWYFDANRENDAGQRVCPCAVPSDMKTPEKALTEWAMGEITFYNDSSNHVQTFSIPAWIDFINRISHYSPQNPSSWINDPMWRMFDNVSHVRDDDPFEDFKAALKRVLGSFHEAVRFESMDDLEEAIRQELKKGKMDVRRAQS